MPSSLWQNGCFCLRPLEFQAPICPYFSTCHSDLNIFLVEKENKKRSDQNKACHASKPTFDVIQPEGRSSSNKKQNRTHPMTHFSKKHASRCPNTCDDFNSPGAMFFLFSSTDERDRVQKKTFTKWINQHLMKVGTNARQSLTPPHTLKC